MIGAPGGYERGHDVLLPAYDKLRAAKKAYAGCKQKTTLYPNQHPALVGAYHSARGAEAAQAGARRHTRRWGERAHISMSFRGSPGNAASS